MPKISALPPMITAAADDEAPVVDDSASSTKKFTLTVLKEWLQSLVGWIATAMLADAAVTMAKFTNVYKFHAYRSSAWTANSGKVSLNAEVFDTNNNFDIATNFRYDVPVSGYYQINFAVSSNQSSGTGYSGYVRKNGSTTIIEGNQIIATQTTSFQNKSSGAGIVQLAAGDYLELMYVGGGSVAGSTGASATFMSGHLVSLT